MSQQSSCIPRFLILKCLTHKVLDWLFCRNHQISWWNGSRVNSITVLPQFPFPPKIKKKYSQQKTSVSYLIPRTDDPSRKHKKVSHGNQAGPNDQGENTQKLLEDWLDADEHKNGQEDSQRCGHSDHKGHVVLDVLEKDMVGGTKQKTVSPMGRAF